MYEEILPQLLVKNDTRVVMAVVDGFSGTTLNKRSELETAYTPYLDDLAKRSSLGLHYPVGYGITPGSGPGHLGLFGYNTIEHQIGRGVIEALGSGMEVGEGDLAVRGNFATKKGKFIVDRRAGRIPTQKCEELVEKIRKNLPDVDGIKFDIKAAKDYRFAVVFHHQSLKDNVIDADPQKTGKAPKPAVARDERSQKTADVINKFIDAISEILADEHPANTCLIRGAANYPDITNFEEKYGMKAEGIAVYPMYKGLSRLVGMDTPQGLKTYPEEMKVLKNNYWDYHFHFIHYKYTDSAGEDGNFDKKVSLIEEFDAFLPEILNLEPEVLVITGDHSTPSIMRSHSWHPVPVVLSSKFAFVDDAQRVTEKEAAKGILGHIPSEAIMMYVMANCGRLAKFGA